MNIDIHHVTRVEGHGNLVVDVKNKKIKVEFQINEGTRLFEAFLRNRRYDEVTHLASRICAICSMSHTMSSLKSIENAMGIMVSEQTEKLRELAILGEHIQSHALHMYCLSLPDYFGFDSIISMSNKYLDEAKNGLMIKKLGNEIAETVAGRAVHQISAVVNGFTKIPSKEQMNKVLRHLKELRPSVLKTVELFSSLDYPDFERKTEYIALKKDDEYALYDGNIASSDGWNADVREWEGYATEQIVEYSNAKQGIRNGHGYMTGPLARINLNFDRLSGSTKDTMKEYGIRFPSYNPFHSNVARSIEVLHCFDTAINIIENNSFKKEKNECRIKVGDGYGANEAPRGTLYYHYKIDRKGIVTYANILTPTAQNLRNLEEDVNLFLKKILDSSKEKIIHNLEMLVRAYDPCISCSVH
ncbi:MAG: Ni/Fe hydrogenase subunit alpha [Thermoplasmatales archaeon]|nr:Ni/Fe hydrogenase subunit alpha [Thermoplasmatales archaeon]